MSLEQGVPREGSPREALEEILGKPWGRCRGELRRKPLRQGVPRKVGLWVGGRWSGLMLSLPHPQKMTKSTSTCLAGADPPVSETFDVGPSHPASCAATQETYSPLWGGIKLLNYLWF